MNDKGANDEANADASGSSPSRRELGLDGNDVEGFGNALSQSRLSNQDRDGTPNPLASTLPLPTRETDIANEDGPLVPISQIAVAFEGMEEGSVTETPTTAAAPLRSASLNPTPPHVHPASAGEGLGADEDEEDERPEPAARSSLSHAGIEIFNEDSMPLMPATQIAAAYKEMEQNIRNSMDAPPLPMPPMPAIHTAAAYKEMEQNIRYSMDGDAPPPPMFPMQADLTGALFKDKEEDNSQKAQDPHTHAIARAFSLTPMEFENMDTASLRRMCERVRHQQEEILRQAQGPPIPAEEDDQHPSPNQPVRTASLPAIASQRESSAITLGRTQSAIVLPMRPPPRSMLPSPGDDDDVTNETSVPTLQVVEATLYEQDSVVYLGTPVENDPWWKKQRVPIAIAVSGLIAGLAIALWATLGFGRESGLASSQPSETQSYLPSLEPSLSSPPSKIPSIHPTFHPSQSVAPNSVLSAPPSTSQVPSELPSSSSSTPPSASAPPTAFCFEGAINVFTDSHPEDTSWTLSRITTEGVNSAKVVGEGSPEDASSPHTYELCLEKGEYEFTIYDSFGDGICCDAGAGHFELVVDGWVVLGGGEFGFSQTASFSLPTASLPPSQSSTPSSSLSPTLQPSMSFGPSSQVPSLGPTLSLGPSHLPSLLPTAPPSTYWSSLVWKQTGQTITGEAPRDLSGRSVVLSGDGMTMAIGSPGLTNNLSRPGYVKVYHREDNASNWQDLGQKIEGTANGNRFGTSLALSEDGKILAIGAPGRFSSRDKPGYVRVYQMEGSVSGSSWTQLGQDITAKAGGDKFGVSVSLSANGRTLAIGDNMMYDDAGGVKIYGRDGDGPNWEQLGQDIKSEVLFVNLGYSVNLSSDGMTVAIGAPGNDMDSEDSGHVRVYRRKGDRPSWEQIGQDIDGEAPGDDSGFSVSLSADGRTLAIGAVYNDSNGDDSGHARVYRINDAGLSWDQLGQDIDGEAAGDHFGVSLSLSADGNTVAIGARANGLFTGHVKVYRIEDGLIWKQVGQDIDGERPHDNAGFAMSLSANGNTVAIGSPGVGDDWGHVRVFSVNH